MQDSFRLLNKYYDKIWVLTIQAAADRRENFARHFERLDYEFFYGADKNQFTIEQVTADNIYNDKLARQHHRYDKCMKHGEIACSWSHKMMYEEMLAKGYEKVLIFEDDALPDPEQMARIPVILHEIPEHADLVWWGWSKNGERNPAGRFKQFFYHIQHRAGKLKWDDRMIRHLYARPFSGQLKIAGFHDYTFAYAINRHAAEKLAEKQTPIQYIADNLLAHASTNHWLKGYIVHPAVFLHDMLPDGTHHNSYIR
ncbi:MAG: glycosyltransferase family 25 protein [Chitinophagaceae bacterium]|nr:glycosyltransferase family 25 protein [Chitinophagaceae bacterium]